MVIMKCQLNKEFKKLTTKLYINENINYEIAIKNKHIIFRL